MPERPIRPVSRGRRIAFSAAAFIAAGSCAAMTMSGGAAQAAPGRSPVIPGDLLVSRVHYTGTPSLITPGVTVLPTGAVAIADGSFAHVWDNVSVDPNFGVTAPIFLDQLTRSGRAVNTIAVPDGDAGPSTAAATTC